MGRNKYKLDKRNIAICQHVLLEELESRGKADYAPSLFIWQAHDGPINVRDMTVWHLKNALNYLEREKERVRMKEGADNE